MFWRQICKSSSQSGAERGGVFFLPYCVLVGICMRFVSYLNLNCVAASHRNLHCESCSSAPGRLMEKTEQRCCSVDWLVVYLDNTMWWWMFSGSLQEAGWCWCVAGNWKAWMTDKSNILERILAVLRGTISIVLDMGVLHRARKVFGNNFWRCWLSSLESRWGLLCSNSTYLAQLWFLAKTNAKNYELCQI